MTDDITITIDHQALGVAPRKLFHLLLWQYFKAEENTGVLDVSVDALNAQLKMAGAVEKRLLLYCEKLSATPLRWIKHRGGDPIESGFCPLISECRIRQGRLHYVFPDALRQLLSRQEYIDRLALKMNDLFRHPYSEPLYELTRGLIEVETGGWWSLDELRQRLNASRDDDFNSLHAVRNRVLSPALEEINALSELDVTVDYRRTPEDAAVKLRVRRKDGGAAAACLRIPGDRQPIPDVSLAQQQAFEAYKADKVCELTQTMSEEEMEAMRQAFVKSIKKNNVLMRKYEKEGFDSLAIKLGFEVFLEEMLLSDRQRDFDWFRLTSTTS